MLRIVGIQRDADPSREFVVLQNQGSMRCTLKGHAVVGEGAFEASELSAVHPFSDDVPIHPGAYVVLFSGVGEGRFVRQKDGSTIYYAFMNRPRPVWLHQLGAVHLLNTQHTYIERGPALFLK